MSAEANTNLSVQPVPRWAWSLLAGVVFLVWVESQRGTSDVGCWYAASSFAHAGQWEGFYDRGINPMSMMPYVPISQSIVLYPLGYLSERGFRVVLTCLILASWLLLHSHMASNAGDGPLGFVNGIATPALAPLLGMIAAGRFLGNDLENGQLNAIYLAISWTALLGMLNPDRPVRLWLGAALLAVGVGLKLVPIVFVALLWCKGAWRPALLSSMFSIAMLIAIPYAVVGDSAYTHLLQYKLENQGKLWLFHPTNHLLFSFSNFLLYHVYVHPLLTGLDAVPEIWFQLVMATTTVLIGLPILWLSVKTPWKATTPMRLWEDVAMVGAAWVIVDPLGEIAHSVMIVPACGLLFFYRLRDWHWTGNAPTRTEWTAILFVAFANLVLFRVSALGGHAFYRATGIYTLGQFTLYALTVLHVARERGSGRRGADSTTKVATDRSLTCRLAPKLAAQGAVGVRKRQVAASRKTETEEQVAPTLNLGLQSLGLRGRKRNG